MSALAVFAVLTMSGASPDSGTVRASGCFRVADQSRGWKQVTITTPSGRLSAPANVPQMKVGQEVKLVSSDLRSVFVENKTEALGNQWFHFHVEPGTHRLGLQFANGLRGAKVDVIAHASNGTSHDLWTERRTRDSTIDLSWDLKDISGIAVVVHSHLRTAASLSHWTTARTVKLGEDVHVLAPFHQSGALYYFNEGNKNVMLCEQNTSALAFDEQLLAGGKPVAAELVPVTP